MTDAAAGDSDLQYLGLLVPALIALIAGLVTHLFIIGVNVTDWWKGRPTTAVDQIVTSLGIPRMFTQCIIVLYVFRNRLFLTEMDNPLTAVIIATVYCFVVYDNVWLTSLLSIVLYLKISTFHSRLFLYLRGVIVHRTVYFIVATVLLASIGSLMPLIMAITDVTEDGVDNITIYNSSMHCNFSRDLYNYIFAGSIPMLFSCISSVLLFASLYHHTAQMKKSSNLSINLETYYSVMKFVSFTFIYVLIYYVGHCVVAIFFFTYCVNLLWIRIVLEFLPVLHSCYLIYRTPKLWSQMSKVLQIVTDFLLQRKDTEPGENTQI